MRSAQFFRNCQRGQLLGTVLLLLTALLAGCSGKTRVYAPPRPEVRPGPPIEQPSLDIPAPEMPAAPVVEEPAQAELLPPEQIAPVSGYQPKLGPAAGLYNDGAKALQAGNLDKAEMLLERALRIEPRNAHYWHVMAQIRLRQGKNKEAIQFCLKSNSLASGISQLIQLNNEMIAQARESP